MPFNPETYRTFTDAQLMDVVHNQQDYLPEAIQAAEAEIARRGLTPAQTTAAEEEMEALRKYRNRRKAFVNDTTAFVKTWLRKHFMRKREFGDANDLHFTVIRIVTVALGGLWLLFMYLNFSNLSYAAAFLPYTETEFIMLGIPALLMPLATIFLWRLTIPGYVLLSLLVCFFWLSASLTLLSYYFLGSIYPSNALTVLWDSGFIQGNLAFLTAIYLSLVPVRKLFNIPKWVPIALYSLALLIAIPFLTYTYVRMDSMFNHFESPRMLELAPPVEAPFGG